MKYSEFYEIYRPYLDAASITATDFNALFHVKKNPADGNCLFYSIAAQLPPPPPPPQPLPQPQPQTITDFVNINSYSAKPHKRINNIPDIRSYLTAFDSTISKKTTTTTKKTTKTLQLKATAKKLRQEVYTFYTNLQFPPTSLPSEESMEYKLHMQYAADNVEYHAITGTLLNTPHCTRIARNGVYAGIVDILALAVLYQRNIVLFHAIDKEHCIIQLYTDPRFIDNEFFSIVFDGLNHFEAVFPRETGISHVGG